MYRAPPILGVAYIGGPLCTGYSYRGSLTLASRDLCIAESVYIRGACAEAKARRNKICVTNGPHEVHECSVVRYGKVSHSVIQYSVVCI